MFVRRSSTLVSLVSLSLALVTCAYPIVKASGSGIEPPPWPGPGATNPPGAPPRSVDVGAPKRTEEVVPAPVAGVETNAEYVIVDSGQAGCYDNARQITCPAEGEVFRGQDAQHAGAQPSYTDNGNGTVTDINTGLMWQQTPNLEAKSTYPEAVAGASTFNLAGYGDWRLPTVKELYSLIDFNGSSATETPYIDTDYFDFRFGDESAGERLIDTQYWTSTEYVGTTFNGDATVFGVNFADGRIKGYPRDVGPGGSPNTNFVRYVRDNPTYGVNDFLHNGDGTITDMATGLTWMKTDSGATMNWEQALDYADNLDIVGYDDWRLPNAKELQSIIDYTQAPDAQDPAQQGPAIDPIFDISETESWFWTSTTLLETPPHLEPGSQAVCLAFGQAYDVFADPQGSPILVNVHGAGAQRSDPKSGDPADWADGRGPQNDEIRIYNYVRCVRDAHSPAQGLPPTAYLPLVSQSGIVRETALS